MEENKCCKHCGYDELAEKISDMTPDEITLYDVAELLKVFGDSTRIRIIFVLCKGEFCVSDIAGQLGMAQSAISHQLRVLKQARLVSTRRDGKTIYYSLCDDHVKTIFYTAMEHIME